MTAAAAADVGAGYWAGTPARRFEAVAFDWDVVAAPDGGADASRIRDVVERASDHGLELVIVSGAPVDDVDGQLAARPHGPGGVILALNGGTEVFSVDQDGASLMHRREATALQEAALSRAAQLTLERLAGSGLVAQIVSGRPNRRRIDLIPELEWKGPHQAAELRAAVEVRLASAGIAGLAEVFEMSRAAATESGLSDARITGDVKHVEIGLSAKSDSCSWIMQWLWRRGIAPEQVLIAGETLGSLRGLPGVDSVSLMSDRARNRRLPVAVGVGPGDATEPMAFPGSGADVVIALLEDQIARRKHGELPVAVADPEWALTIEDADPLLERVHESLATLADGRLGTRGTVLARRAGREPAVLMSGIYARAGAETHLLAAPRWNEVVPETARRGPGPRVLDLHAGLLHERSGSEESPIEALLISSLARPATTVLRAKGRIPSARLAGLLEPPSGVTREEGEDEGVQWMRVTGKPASIVAAAAGQIRGGAHDRVLDRVAAYEGCPEGVADRHLAVDRARAAMKVGFDALLAEHRQAWAQRWEDADVRIEGDPQLQLAVRFALFHLIGSVRDEGEAAVGARGLSGRAYRGHVFWDSDVYVLPFLAATHPAAGRAMLEYRIRRLPAALRAARALGRRGARFPWESARSGHDVAPDHVRDHHGQTVPVLTGELEEHIVADVAWAAACYIDWTGDQAFAMGPGRDLLVETARWWASRIEPDGQGCGHIRGVIGPDEYHERVDDNAYTNVMARWNLRRAAGADAVDERERRRWLQLAETIVDGYDPTTGIYEQFAGFHALEPIVITELGAQRPIAADMLLGHERTRGAQVVKQADVLMLHYLVPDEVHAGSLEPNVDFYEPRTAHGSTLSPGVHAALLARAGRLEQALHALHLTARIDLDDIGHTTAGGLHLAAMGSVWRAMAYGFAGLRPVGDALAFDPVLPADWESLELRVRFRDSRVRARISPGRIELSAEPPVTALDPAGERVELTAKARAFELTPPSRRGPT